MRILALVTDGFGSSGGIAQYNCDLMGALSRSRHIERIVLLPRFGNIVAARPDKVVQLEALSSPYLWAARAVHLAVRGGFDVIFCGHMNVAPFAAKLARMTRKPLWVQAHGIEAWEDRGAKFRRALSEARLVTAVSRHTRRRLLAWGDVDPAKVRVLPNTFDQVYIPTSKRGDLVARYGLNDKKVILTVGRMSAAERYKGHDRIIRCLEEVRIAVPQAVYLIVGTGDDQPRLESLSRWLGISEKVIFAGPVPVDQLVDHYALADVFAMPSTGEGFGIVFLEAAAAGLPVIGGDGDGSVDALADGAVGHIINTGDKTALVDALVIALTSGIKKEVGALLRFATGNFSNHVSELVRSIKN